MPDPSDPKPWWQSKSVWLGGVLTVIGVSTYFQDPSHTPVASLASISAAVGGVAAVVLRVWFTSAPIEGTRRAARVIAARVARQQAVRGPL